MKQTKQLITSLISKFHLPRTVIGFINNNNQQDREDITSIFHGYKDRNIIRGLYFFRIIPCNYITKNTMK